MAHVFTSPGEIRAVLGAELGPSGPLVVGQDRIDAFADVTDDHQWVHVDPRRAETGPFGTTVAHGFLTLSLIPHFGRDLFELNFGSARVNYGLNKVRFPEPVRVGAELRATVTFLEATEVAVGAMLTARYVLIATGSAKPACVADMLLLVAPAGAANPEAQTHS
jgi:acyl dehydratase